MNFSQAFPCKINTHEEIIIDMGKKKGLTSFDLLPVQMEHPMYVSKAVMRSRKANVLRLQRDHIW